MTADPGGDRAAEDLTARARIRDAAIQLFAERGIEGATIRDIAKAAGVSSGLVRHHFGSKEALREACDAYAMERMARIREQMFNEGRLSDQGFVAGIHPTAMLLQNYLVRSMLDGSGTAATMFDAMVRAGDEWMAGEHPYAGGPITSRDPQAYIAVLVAMQLGVFAMRDQISRVLGVDVGTPEGHMRIQGAMVEIFSQPLLSPENAAQVFAAMDTIQRPDGGTRRAAETKEQNR